MRDLSGGFHALSRKYKLQISVYVVGTMCNHIAHCVLWYMDRYILRYKKLPKKDVMETDWDWAKNNNNTAIIFVPCLT